MQTDTLSIAAGATTAASADDAPAAAFAVRRARWVATGVTLFAIAAVLLASGVAVVMSLS